MWSKSALWAAMRRQGGEMRSTRDVKPVLEAGHIAFYTRKLGEGEGSSALHTCTLVGRSYFDTALVA